MPFEKSKLTEPYGSGKDPIFLSEPPPEDTPGYLPSYTTTNNLPESRLARLAWLVNTEEVYLYNPQQQEWGSFVGGGGGSGEVSNLDASVITTGTFDPDRIPDLSTIYSTINHDHNDIYYTKTESDQQFQDISIVLSNINQSYLVEGGGVAWVTGYEYRVSSAIYYINGIRYTSNEQTVTLDNADPSNDRLDIIALDITGTAIKITGTPAPNPNSPEVDPKTQLVLSTVVIDSNTTEPESTSNNIVIYAENAEWTATPSAGTINPNSTNNPRSGTKTIEGTNVSNGTYIQLQSGSNIDLSLRDVLVLYIRSKGSFGNKTISVRFRNSGVNVGQTVTLAHGFNSSNTSAYQQIVIPLSQFAISSVINQVQFTVVGGGGNIGFYVDDISLQDTYSVYEINSISHVEADARYLIKSSNLSDLQSVSTARSNLGLVIGTNIEAHDQTLTALAGVVTAADKIIYATGIDTFTTTDLTSTARSLLDDTSTSDMRTTLGLVIGTNVQAQSTALDSLSGANYSIDANGYSFVDHATFLLARGSDLTTGTNVTITSYILPSAGKFWKWKLEPQTNPAGGGFSFDIMLNGSSIFSAPQVVSANTTATQSGNTFNTATFAEGDKLTINITAAGTGVQYIALYLYYLVKNI